MIQDTFTHSGDLNPHQIIRQVIAFTLLMEFIGTAVLFFGLSPASTGAADALWKALFHAVSAFCNAGFSLFPDSLVGFRGSWLVNLTVCLLIVAGGIGFLVAAEIRTIAAPNLRSWRTTH